MSLISQPLGVDGSPSAIAIGHFDMHQGVRFDEHRHDRYHQIVWARSGVLTVEVQGTSWVLPSSLALWLPAGVLHAVSATKPALMGGLYVDAARSPVGWAEPTTVSVSPLLAQLFEHLADEQLAPAPRERVEAVVFDLLTPVAVTTIEVPLPTDERARRIAEAIVADPADDRELDAWGHEVGASVRTLTRLFRRDTQLSFSDWRTLARMRAAIGLLAAGTPVAVVSRRVGYATPSSFVASFRRVTGTTPGGYFGTAARTPERPSAGPSGA